MGSMQIISPWYQSLVDDVRAAHVEAVHNSRWELLAGYHAIGERIATEKRLKWNERGNGATLQGLAKSTGVSGRNLYYAIKFYEMFPRLEDVPNGKNISWHKVTTQLLTKKTKTKFEKYQASVESWLLRGKGLRNHKYFMDLDEEIQGKMNNG